MISVVRWERYWNEVLGCCGGVVVGGLSVEREIK